jgi:ABC-type nitrate/sulfonate/bicarbonate transport system substrate-binding protein
MLNLRTQAWAADSALTPVNIVNASGNATMEFQSFIEQLGYLRNYALAPKFSNVGDGPKQLAALLSGDSDIAVFASLAPILPAIEKGAKIRVVAGCHLLTEQGIVTKNPSIKSMKDLVGKTVGTGAPGSLLHQEVVALAQKAGVDYTKITYANVGSSADVFRAVVQGTIDAGPVQTDNIAQAAKYGAHSLTDGNMWTEAPLYTPQGSMATLDAIQNKRDLLVKTLAAYAKTYRYVQDDPKSKDDFIKARVDALGEKNKDDAVAGGIAEWNFYQQYKPFAGDLLISKERFDYMQKINLELGIQQRMMAFEEIADMSLAEEALKLVNKG